MSNKRTSYAVISERWQGTLAASCIAIDHHGPGEECPVVFGTPSQHAAIVSQVQTNNDVSWVKTRQTNATAAGFSVALEEDDVQTEPHGTETIGWLAIEARSGTWNGHQYIAGSTPNSVTHNWYTLNLSTGFTVAPQMVASLATYDGGDGSYLRYQSLTANSVQVKIEEDTTADTEVNHTTEVVAYLLLEGSGDLPAGLHRRVLLQARKPMPPHHKRL